MYEISRIRFGALVVLVAWVVPHSAMADGTARECIDANANAQPLRRDRKLALAREQLLVCMSKSCPSIIAKDCIERFEELERVQPTIAFEARDGSGADLTAVKVTLDGKVFTEKLDGALFPIDPGVYTATFEAAGSPPVTRSLVINEGDKGRRERVVLGSPPAAVSVAIEPTTAAHDRGGGTQKTLAFVSGGAGVLGVVLGGIFGGLALSEKSNVQSLCATSCSASVHTQALGDHSTGITDSTVSTVGFIAGGALLAGAVALFFTAPKVTTEPSPPPPSARWTVSPRVGAAGGGLTVIGEF